MQQQLRTQTAEVDTKLKSDGFLEGGRNWMVIFPIFHIPYHYLSNWAVIGWYNSCTFEDGKQNLLVYHQLDSSPLSLLTDKKSLASSLSYSNTPGWARSLELLHLLDIEKMLHFIPLLWVLYDLEKDLTKIDYNIVKLLLQAKNKK